MGFVIDYLRIKLSPEPRRTGTASAAAAARKPSADQRPAPAANSASPASEWLSVPCALLLVADGRGGGHVTTPGDALFSQILPVSSPPPFGRYSVLCLEADEKDRTVAIVLEDSRHGTTLLLLEGRAATAASGARQTLTLRAAGFAALAAAVAAAARERRAIRFDIRPWAATASAAADGAPA